MGVSRWLAASLLVISGIGSVFAQREDAVTIPLRVVNGHLIVLADLVGLEGTNDASFDISLEYPAALTLHHDQYDWLGLDPKDPAKGPDALMHLLIEPGIKLSIPAREIVPEESRERVAQQNSLTKLHSAALGERKVKGTIGIGLLRKYHVRLDIQERQLILSPPRAGDEYSPDTELADIVIHPFEYKANRILVPVNYHDTRKGQMAIAGTRYDTSIDATVARSLDKPAGDVGPAWLIDTRDSDQRLDLSRYVAFRPDAPNADDGPVIIAGVNLLEHFRVELDWAHQTIAFTRKAAPRFPQSDLEFFQAEVTGTSDAMQAYLEKHPGNRLSADAAHTLLRWRLDKDGASDEGMLNALKWVVETALPGRKAEQCLEYVAVFHARNRIDLAIGTAKEGLRHAREAFDARVVYRLHNTLGAHYMAKGDVNEAWKHFLSVAFMLPDDAMTNLNLARIYDRQGRVRRAYSRYRRVAAGPSLGLDLDLQVTAALERLRQQLPKDDVLLNDEKSSPRKPGV